MRSAKVGLVTRTVASAAAALCTVPAGRDRCTFLACSSSVRAYRTALACKVSMRRCAALRRPTFFGLVCTCRLHECGGIGQCVLLHSVCTSACTVGGRIATRTASIHERAAQISIARRAGHACSCPAPAGSLPSWSHCGRFVVHERRHLRPLALRCFCNSACDGRVDEELGLVLEDVSLGKQRCLAALASVTVCTTAKTGSASTKAEATF
jgi:hypothetical protein